MSALIAPGMLRQCRTRGIGHVDNHPGDAAVQTAAVCHDRTCGATYLRLGAGLRWLLVLGAIAAVRRHGGTPADYLGLAAASAASWVGAPGPGSRC